MPDANSDGAAARRFTIYGLVDPRDGLIHYIGRTANLRARVELEIVRGRLFEIRVEPARGAR